MKTKKQHRKNSLVERKQNIVTAILDLIVKFGLSILRNQVREFYTKIRKLYPLFVKFTIYITNFTNFLLSLKLGFSV